MVPAGRIVGVDVARCLALLGMMATHILPSFDEDGLTVAQSLAGGRASALFAVLAGVSLALLHGGHEPARGREWKGAAAGVAMRASVIGLVGLVLGELRTGIAVILTYYALLFLLAVPFLALRARPLLVLAAGWVLAVPVLSHLVRAALPETTYLNPSLHRLDEPVQLLGELTFTGYYPAVPWLAYLLVGLALGRLDLRSPAVALRMVLLGVAFAVAATVGSQALLGQPEARRAVAATFSGAGWQGTLERTLDHGLHGTTPTGSWWWLAVAAPHSGTPFDLAQTIGSAVFVLGMCLLVAQLAPRVLAVALGAGAMTLTLYSGHVVSRQEGLWDGEGWTTYLGQVAVVLLVGAVFRIVGRRGPLEALVGDLSRSARLAVAGPPAASPADRVAP